MPLPIVPPVEAPEQRTCESYTVRRLGAHPSMNMVFTETVTDVVSMNVVAAVDTDEDGLFDLLSVSLQYPYIFLPSDTAGKELLKADNSSFGICASLTGGLRQIILAAGVATDPTGEVLHFSRVNGFGELVARPAVGGKTYTRRLSAEVPEQLTKMQQVLGTVAFNLVLGVLTQLGLSANPLDVVQALQTMAGQGDNLDSFIVRELESLEEDIANGDVPGMPSQPI